jgi:fibrillarin-like pre-rRNA processing protein
MKLERLNGVDNLYWLKSGRKRQLATRNKTPSKTTYGEKLVQINGCQMRIWNPRRSKLAAALHKKTPLNIKKTDKILYLGAATGTTLSHLSDINTEGVTYAVEISPVSIQKLLLLCEARDNIIPLLEDASQPQRYQHVVEEVDVIYQDIAQRNQAEIAMRNAELFLRKGGQLILALKARSINTTANLGAVLKKEVQTLEDKLTIQQITNLSPYHKSHYLITAEKPK